jgi:uncharacterized membrane protein required for colicin V production
MWIDAVAVLLVVAFTALGCWRGTLATLLQMITLLAAYGLAFVLGPRLGPQLALELDLPELAGSAITGIGIFVLATLVLSTVAYFIRKRDEADRNGRSILDRAGGGALGLVKGALVALLVGFLANWLAAGRSIAQISAIPDTSASRVGPLSRDVIERAARPLIDESDPGARVALHLATRPGETLVAARNLMERDEIRALEGDSLFWSYLENEQIDSALNTRTFLEISYRREIRQQFVDFGLADPRGVEDTKFFRDEMKAMLEELAPRVRALRSDPELARLSSDPEIARAIEERDTAALLAHPGLQELVQRVLDAPDEPARP